MQNRKDRRLMEKQMGLKKIEKSLSPEERESVKQRKAEYLKQSGLIRAQEAENKRINEEANMWNRQLQSMVSSGMTMEQAQNILEKNREIDKKRSERLAKK
jgi:hypothetical protein